MPKLYKLVKPHTPHRVPSQLHSRVSLRNSIDNHITKAHTCVHVAWTFTLLTNNTPYSFYISFTSCQAPLFCYIFENYKNNKEVKIKKLLPRQNKMNEQL